MFCPNCGKELAEGEICTCAQTNEEIVENTAKTEAPAAEAEQPNNFNPPIEQEGFNPQMNAPFVFPGTYYDPQKAYENAQPEEKLPARTDYPEGYKIKKKYVAVLLAASLGMFGIHNFYLGNKDKALAQVLIATVGGILSLGLSFAAVTIWATVEAVLLLTEDIDRDANGYKIQTFEEAVANQMKKGE
jgi:TM2 domain-containing membrane protein YozV